MKGLAALAALAFVGCTGASQSTATPTPPAAPSPTASTAAESKAADFRIRLDLLLGEHVIIIAKQSSATSRPAEYTSYLRLLTTNSADLMDLVRSALGDSVATHFGQVWSGQNDFLVTYTIGLATHNKAKSDAAQAGLTSVFVPQFSQLLNDLTQIPSSLILPLVSQHALETKAILDDQALRNYPKLYADLRASYAHATQVGDAIAPRIAGRFPDKFPGNASSPAADLRASLNIRWQEHSYLSTMRTAAAVGGRTTEQAAAAGALTENADAIDAVLTGIFGAPSAIAFGHLWAAANTASAVYANAAAATSRQRALSDLTDASVAQMSTWLAGNTGLAADASRPALEAQLEALVTVIDDQRTKSWSRLAANDRAAETATEVVADLIASATIARFAGKFG